MEPKKKKMLDSFDGQLFTAPSGEVIPVLTLRDWFAGHAPDTPQWDFDVPMPTKRPASILNGRECINEGEIHKWDDERERRRLMMWPWVWADAMLRERAKGEGLIDGR